MTYYNDYLTEPVGGDNPYYRCIHCRRTDPDINGELEGHDEWCQYRILKEMGEDYPAVLYVED